MRTRQEHRFQKQMEKAILEMDEMFTNLDLLQMGFIDEFCDLLQSNDIPLDLVLPMYRMTTVNMYRALEKSLVNVQQILVVRVGGLDVPEGR